VGNTAPRGIGVVVAFLPTSLSTTVVVWSHLWLSNEQFREIWVLSVRIERDLWVRGGQWGLVLWDS
jgi:hypothetical protein